MKIITQQDIDNNFAICTSIKATFNNICPNGLNVCWECFKEAQGKGLNLNGLTRFINEEDDLIVQKNRTWTNSFPGRFIFNNKALKIMERAYEQKKDFRDFDYIRSAKSK